MARLGSSARNVKTQETYLLARITARIIHRHAEIEMSARRKPDRTAPMFRLFDMLGPSAAIRALDDALRGSGVHPLLVPEPVKLTVIRLNTREDGPRNQDVAFAEASQLLAYCMLGHEQFATSNSSQDADRIDSRVEAALDDGDTLDAKLILLALHAGLIAPEIADRIDLDDV